MTSQIGPPLQPRNRIGSSVISARPEGAIFEDKGAVRVATSATLAILLFHLTKNLERPRQLNHLGSKPDERNLRARDHSTEAIRSVPYCQQISNLRK